MLTSLFSCMFVICMLLLCMTCSWNILFITIIIIFNFCVFLYHHIQIIEELLLKCGFTFQSITNVQDAFRSVQEEWINRIMPAVAAMLDEPSLGLDETQSVITGKKLSTYVYML